MHIEFYGIIIILAAWIGLLFYPHFCKKQFEPDIKCHSDHAE